MCGNIYAHRNWAKQICRSCAKFYKCLDRVSHVFVEILIPAATNKSSVFSALSNTGHATQLFSKQRKHNTLDCTWKACRFNPPHILTQISGMWRWELDSFTFRNKNTNKHTYVKNSEHFWNDIRLVLMLRQHAVW